MATLAGKLDDYQWWFYEQGGMHIYNELKRLANDASDGTNVDMATAGTFSTYGAIVLDASAGGGLAAAISLPVNRPQALGYTRGVGVNPTRPPTQYQG